MSTLDDLLIRWQDGSLDDAGIVELKLFLADETQRAALVRHLHASATISEMLREEAAATPPGNATERLRAVGQTIRASQLAADGGNGSPHQRPRQTNRPHSRPRPRGAQAFRPGRFAALVCGVVLVFAVALTFLRQHLNTPSVFATIELPTSAVEAHIIRAGETETRQPCKSGMMVYVGDRIETATGELHLHFPDDATVLAMGPHSMLTASNSPGRREIRLAAGQLTATVAKQPPDRALVFITTQAEARVIGTQLTLTTDTQQTRLTVRKGTVRFTALADGAILDVETDGAALASASGVRRVNAAAARLLPTHGTLWGVSLRSEPQMAQTLSALETGSGRHMAVVHQYMGFSDYDHERPFPTATQRLWADGGRRLAIAWKPRIGDQQLRWSDVADGRYDTDYVDVLARKAAEWGQPFFFTLHHDPEELVGPAGSGMTPGDFVRMWRHIHERFTAAGATQVAWVWTMSGAQASASLWNKLYPGDDYVDWLACAAYNNAHSDDPTVNTDHWHSFTQLVTPFISWARVEFQGDHAKPIMIAVYACAEQAENAARKEAWFRSLPAQLPQFPEIRALLYFHDRALRADSSPAALAGFRAASAAPLFQTESVPTPNGDPGVKTP